MRCAQEVATREPKSQHLEEQEHLIELHLVTLGARDAIVGSLDQLREQLNEGVVTALNIAIGAQEAQVCKSLQLLGSLHFLRRLIEVAGARVEDRRSTLIGQVILEPIEGELQR